MDKSRDVRRVLSLCSGHNHINNYKRKLVVSELSGGGAVFTAKSRREKLTRLSLLGRGHRGGGCQEDQGTKMGSVGSDGEDELPSSTASAKKLKFHKKISEDSNAVDHAPIPRKLRSVIRKRSCHSISLPLPNPKRINHVNGLQTTKKDCLKKSKSTAFACESMTKDEEEVAEALYALAGTVPSKVTPFLNKSDGESPYGKQMDLEKLEDSLLSSQGPPVPEEGAEVTCNLTSEESSKQKIKADDLGKSTFFSQPKLPENTQPNIKSGTKLNNFEQEAHLSQRISENTGDLASEDKQNEASIESKENGSELLPSLYSHASHGSRVDEGFLSRYSTSKIPNWLHTVASSSEPGLHQPQVSHRSESEVETHKGKIKSRSATHVYISHFIQLSQDSEAKEIPLLEAYQFRPSEGVTLGVLKASNHLNTVSNGSTKMFPGSHIYSSFPEKNLLEASNDALMMPRSLLHGQEQAPLAPGNSTLRKQCYDFLSLSTGSSGIESKADANRNGIVLDHLAELQVPKLQPLTRYESASSLPLPPNLLPSNSYQHQLSASAKPQLPFYFNRSIQLDSSATSITKQAQVQPRAPQQQPVWMAQLAAQYRPGTLAPAQVAHWQNPRQEPQIVQYTQAQIPASQSSLVPGAHFPKYLQMAQQHHQMLHFSPPFPPIRANSHHSPVPISCDKSGS